MGALTRWTVFPTDHPTLGKVYLGAAGQRCRLTGFEPLDRLSSTNCLSWQPWQGNAWPYSWNPKRQFFSAMFSEQMRYILYFDQYQCRFGGCTHAACYFSAYYSITAVVSACAFAGFEKNAPCLSIFYTYSASFFSCRRRAVLPTAVSLSVQLILFTSFFHSGLPPLGVPYASSIAGLLCVSVSACVVCCVAVLCVVWKEKKGFYRDE